MLRVHSCNLDALMEIIITTIVFVPLGKPYMAACRFSALQGGENWPRPPSKATAWISIHWWLQRALLCPAGPQIQRLIVLCCWCWNVAGLLMKVRDNLQLYAVKSMLGNSSDNLLMLLILFLNSGGDYSAPPSPHKPAVTHWRGVITHRFKPKLHPAQMWHTSDYLASLTDLNSLPCTCVYSWTTRQPWPGLVNKLFSRGVQLGQRTDSVTFAHLIRSSDVIGLKNMETLPLPQYHYYLNRADSP